MARPMKESGVEWIGKIPKDWKLIKGRYCYNIQSGFPFESDKFSVVKGIPLIRIRDITSGLIETYYDGDYPEEYVVNQGDFLIGMDGDFNVRMWANCPALLNQRCCRLFEYSGYERKYLFYVLPYYLDLVNQLTYSTTVKHLSVPDLREADIPSPSLDEQCRIVRYLDAKCSLIDSVVVKTQETIEEYKKLKQSVITEAVTKGVRGKRPMKDSGSAWFGKIPSDWNMVKFKHIVHIRKDIAGTEGYTVLSITQRGIIPKDLSKNEGQLASDYSNYQLVDVGDFAMNHMDLLTGWVDISKYNGVTSPDYRVFALNDSKVSYAEYYLYLVQMCYIDRIFYSLGQGVSGFGRWRLPADQFLNFLVAVPSYNEQKEIAEYIERKCAAIDALIEKKQQFIDELTAYKKSLIYEYVTGKREVPV